MTRPLDPKGKTAQIVILPTNDEEEKLFRDFKRILAKDSITVREFFLEQIQHKVSLDNPQLHFEPVEGGLILNKIVEAKESPWVICDKCEGTGQNEVGRACEACGGFGKYTEDKT
jgi:hypothetical protein